MIILWNIFQCCYPRYGDTLWNEKVAINLIIPLTSFYISKYIFRKMLFCQDSINDKVRYPFLTSKCKHWFELSSVFLVCINLFLRTISTAHTLQWDSTPDPARRFSCGNLGAHSKRLLETLGTILPWYTWDFGVAPLPTVPTWWILVVSAYWL